MDPGGAFVRVVYTQPYSFDEWRTVIEVLRRDPLFAFQRRIGALIDRSGVGPSSADFIDAVAAYVQRHPLLLKGRRLAFVARDHESTADAWQLARMYEEAGAISTVFGSRPDAEGWLREAAPGE
jgi:hypothetical protein